MVNPYRCRVCMKPVRGSVSSPPSQHCVASTTPRTRRSATYLRCRFVSAASFSLRCVLPIPGMRYAYYRLENTPESESKNLCNLILNNWGNPVPLGQPNIIWGLYQHQFPGFPKSNAVCVLSTIFDTFEQSCCMNVAFAKESETNWVKSKLLETF